MPRNDNPASTKIALAIPNAILTNTGAKAFGKHV